MRKVALLSLISSIMLGVYSKQLMAEVVLDPVIVTATLSEIDPAEAPGSVTVISRQEIEQKGGENLLDLVRGTTGISLQGIGSGGRKSLSLRGLESKHTLVLVDGKRIPASNDVIGPNTDYQYDWVPLGQIERVEVVRGPMSVLYGADALGGVINIITRKPSESFSGNVAISGHLANGDTNNDGDAHNLEFNMGGALNKKLRLTFAGQQSRRESLESKNNLGQSAIEGRKKQQLTAGLDWQASDKHAFNLNYSTAQEDRWNDTATRTNVLYQSQYDIDREQLTLGWKGTIGKTDNSVRVYQSEVDIRNSATNGVSPTVPQNLRDTVIEGNSMFSLGEKQFITLGLEHRTEELKNENLPSGKADFTLNSFFLQDQIDINDRTLITLGARYDEHDSFGSEVSPRASIVYSASDNLKLKGSYGHGFRAPNLKQVTPGYSFPLGFFVIDSNPDLKPETNDAYELGLNYTTDKLNLNAAIFDNKVKNLIDTRFDAFLPGGVLQRWTYDNIDSARLKGAELSSKIELRPGLHLTGNYQYLDAKNGDGEILERRPRHTLAAGVSWEKNGWQLNLNAQHLAGQLIEESRIIKEVPDYTVWNVGMRKSLSKKIIVTAGIENLGDVRLEDKSSAFRHEEYPRTFRLGINIGFD